ncbi:MAG: hypothetical protein ACJA13_000411 [Paraglaciecola sp.]|jgi:hypothetical protein
MKTAILLLAMLMCSSTHAGQVFNSQQDNTPVIDAPAVLGDYFLSYELFRSGKRRGKAQRQITTGADGKHTLTMQAEASLFFYTIKTCESSQFSFVNDTLMPLSYDKIDSRTFKDKKTLHLEFDHSKAELRGSNGKEDWSNSFTGEVFDPLLVVEKLRLVAQKGEYTDLQFPVYDDKKLSQYHFIYQGLEKVKTSVGSFQTVKYTRVRDNSSRRTSFWLAMDNQFIPIKVRQEKDGDEQATLIIASPILSSKTAISESHKGEIKC